MADKGFITIYKQSLAAEASSAVPSGVAGLSPDGKVTAAALLGEGGGQPSALGDSSASASTTVMHTSREAAVAAVCKQVAVNGFEPISDVFSLSKW